MAALSVRVNPDNPEEFAVRRPYWDAPRNSTLAWFLPNGEEGAQFIDGSDDTMNGWVRVEIEIPRPARVFREGDVLRSGLSPELVRVRDSKGKWIPITGGFNSAAFDDAEASGRLKMHHKPDTYLGNINDLGADNGR